eukprot:scaffold68508_cov55-Phaeocystis_antarctica.AAC.7
MDVVGPRTTTPSRPDPLTSSGPIRIPEATRTAWLSSVGTTTFRLSLCAPRCWTLYVAARCRWHRSCRTAGTPTGRGI